MKTTLLFSIICFLLVLFGSTHAKTIVAASVAIIDVKNAISAATDGDTVLIPAGTSDWGVTDSARGKGSAVTFSKALVVKGAGIDKTVIKNGMISSYATKSFRICHMTFDGSVANANMMGIVGTSKAWRVDHIKFLNFAQCLAIYGDTYGLVDHCYFWPKNVNSWTAQLVWFDGPNDSAYTKPLQWGTANAIFFEDNDVDYGTSWETGNCPWLAGPSAGINLVVRHNKIINTQIEIYPPGWGIASRRGCLLSEIYDNEFSAVGTRQGVPNTTVGWGSGTGVFFNNKITGTNYGTKDSLGHVVVTVYGVRTGQAWGALGACDGTKPYDGNLIPAGQPGAGWPCLDQPGRGAYVAPRNGYMQEAAPIYAWNNIENGRPLRLKTKAGPDSAYIKEGREYYNETPKPNYTPYTYPHPLQTILGDGSVGITSSSPLPSIRPNVIQVAAGPFNGSISISLNGSPTQESSVRIYNLRGQEVADLTPSFIGKSQVQWDAKDLAAGVFLVRANIGGQVHTARVLLQK